jgi:hypothetical protein
MGKVIFGGIVCEMWVSIAKQSSNEFVFGSLPSSSSAFEEFETWVKKCETWVLSSRLKLLTTTNAARL